MNTDISDTRNVRKYITVRIEIPIEVFDDGQYALLHESISMDFIPCDSIPTEITIDKKMIMKKYQDILDHVISSDIFKDEFDVVNPDISNIDTHVSDKSNEVESVDWGLTRKLPIVEVDASDIVTRRYRSGKISFKKRHHLSVAHINGNISNKFTVKRWH